MQIRSRELYGCVHSDHPLRFMKYIKELDSIRGIGIIIVVLYHWIPVDSFYNTFPNRPFGVDVFFVLSGFLITNILLASRLEAEAHGVSRKYAFVNFFFHRALRIFPIYFLVVFIIVISHAWLGAQLGDELIPALTYTINFYFYDRQYWGDLTTHLWTLSIEEQFYLFWPWFMLLVNRKYLLHVIVLFTALGVVSQLLITDQEFGYLPTNTCFDAFGIGAFISWIRIFRPHLLGKTYRVTLWLGIASSIALIVAAAFPDLIFLSPQRTLRSLVAAWAITFVIYKDQKNELHAIPVFSNKILLFIGKISYGMYLYHIFFPWIYHILNAPLNGMLPDILLPYISYITLVENFAILVMVSWLSYQYIERPIMRLRNLRRISGSLTPAAVPVQTPIS